MSLIAELLDLDILDPELYASCLECECGEVYRFETGGWLASYHGAYQEQESCPACGRPLTEMLARIIAILSAGDITDRLLYGVNEMRLSRYGSKGAGELARRDVYAKAKGHYVEY